MTNTNHQIADKRNPYCWVRTHHTSYIIHQISYIALLFAASCLPVTAQTLSPSAKVSLLTIGPGEELYSSFGHSAIWISDPTTGLDRNYNYGSFDFRADNFYVKFLRGTLPYQISVHPLKLEAPYWQAENRRITEQELNLSLAQKQRLLDLLETNYLPQNREYAYKFFYDNCSTRLRDMFQNACGDSLKYSPQSVGENNKAKSYRDWMNDYLTAKNWAQFGMNAAIGLPADHVASPAQEMYLPNNLMKHLDRATLGGQPLVKQTQTLFEPTPPEDLPFWQKLLEVLVSPSMVAFLLFWVVFRVQLKNPVAFNAPFWFDKIFFGFVGFWGCFVLLLWVGTDHGVTAWNQNLLWLMPLHLPFAFMLGKSKYNAILQPYVTVCLLLAVAALGLCLVGIVLRSQWIPFPTTFLLPLIINRLNSLRQRLTVTKNSL